MSPARGAYRWLVFDKAGDDRCVYGSVWSTKLWFDARAVAEQKFRLPRDVLVLKLLQKPRRRLSDKRLCRSLRFRMLPFPGTSKKRRRRVARTRKGRR